MAELSFSADESDHVDLNIGARLGDYRLEQLLERSEAGRVFLARDAAGMIFRLRILAVPSHLEPEARMIYLGLVQKQANQVAELKHTHILALLHYGIYSGLPYLVYPHYPMETLSRYLTQRGPMDALLASRYLDQIAEALEYGHQHGILHRNLSTDRIFVRPDGKLVVADFGVLSMLEQGGLLQRDVAAGGQPQSAQIQIDNDAGASSSAESIWKEEEDAQKFKVRATPVSPKQAGQPVVLETFVPSAPAYVPPLETPAQGNASQPPTRDRSPRMSISRFGIIIALVLIILAGATLGLLAIVRNGGTNPTLGTNATGQITFFDNANAIAGHTDALKISIQGLAVPPSGSQYDAWLVNDASEQITALGALTTSGQAFALSYAGNGSGGRTGANLLGLGDRVEITLEQGSVNSPNGQVMLSAAFPPKAFVHIKHLLFSFPTTPGKVGLVAGLLDQAQLLDAQALLLQSAAANGNTSAIQCASQSIIDIVEGTQGTAYLPLPDQCLSANVSVTGDGFGMLGSGGYIELAAQHAALAATQTDSTSLIRLHAGHVEIAMSNIKGWLTKVEQDALVLRAAPDNAAVIQEIVTLSHHVYQGVDTNGRAGSVNKCQGDHQGRPYYTLRGVLGYAV